MFWAERAGSERALRQENPWDAWRRARRTERLELREQGD